MAKISGWFVPKEERFFDLLTEQSANVVVASQALKTFIDGFDKATEDEVKAAVQGLKALESRGDDLQHDIIERLNRTFITPVDKEDLHGLTTLIDDLIDIINATALRFALLDIPKTDEYIRKLADVSVRIVAEVHQAIVDLRKLTAMREHHLSIMRLEKEADTLAHKAVYDLFHEGKDPVRIIKYKEIYELLEHIADKCKEISREIESVVVKHA